MMPYKYRYLDPKERESLVEYRRKCNYPLHAPPHPYRASGWYFLTASNFQHVPVMRSPERRDEFEAQLLDAFRSIDADVSGWVILPNHYHILVGVDSLNSVSATLKQLHGKTARGWNLADGMSGRRRVWYKFTDQWIRDERHYYQVLNYIHYNPVKHKYVDEPYAWIWSSVHSYFDTKGRDWLRATWKDYPVGNFGTGWDD